MFKFIAAVCFASLASGFEIPETEEPHIEPRIIVFGGEPVGIESVPYQVSFRQFHEHHCGGSIISKYWIVSAAHCIDPNPPTDYTMETYTVYAGSSNKNFDGSEHGVERIVVHPDFKYLPDPPAHDIALIRVSEPFEFDKTRQPIGLFDIGEETPVREKGVISGWGKTENKTMSDTLRRVEVPVISKEQCKLAYDNYTDEFNEHQICAVTANGKKDACQGDSGGPLAVAGLLAGVVSWGVGCGIAGQPGVYTEIAGHRAWIDEVLSSKDS